VSTQSTVTVGCCW